jgi:hypothetical protein
MKRVSVTLMATALIAVVIGCDEDKRLVNALQDAADRQAEQNREIAYQSHQVAEATKAIVEADAQARKELAALQRDLQAEQAQINQQRDELESERREIAKQRQRDPIIAAAINNVGLILACLISLAVAGYLLYCLRDRSDDQVVGEILIEELLSDDPVLLPPPQANVAAIEDQRNPRPPSIAQAEANEDEKSIE